MNTRLKKTVRSLFVLTFLVVNATIAIGSNPKSKGNIVVQNNAIVQKLKADNEVTSLPKKEPKASLTRFVDPFIGTLGNGDVFAGACLPHGFIKLGPDTKYYSGAAGYKKNKDIEGFSHMHISGMGAAMYGNIQLIPTTGDIEPLKHSSGKGEEISVPGYYKVELSKYKTVAELTPTSRAGFHRYTFPKSESSHILIDVGATLYGTKQNWGSSQPIGGELHIDPIKKVVYGHNSYRGGRTTTKPWKVYFYAVFDTRFDSFGAWVDSVKYDGVNTIKGNEIGAYLNFNTTNAQQIKVKVGISMISIQKAEENVGKEIPDWNFEHVKNQANLIWENELEKIEVTGMSEKNNRMFYTAMYHALFAPANWTGENPVFNYNRPYYEDFLCVWDIFRTVSPLLTLISTKEHTDMLNTLLDVYRHDGWLADAHSALQREHIQVGSNTDVLFADAYAKKLKGIDYNMAYEAVKKNATETTRKVVYAGRPALPLYLKYHYIPIDAKQKITVSRTLEYVYNDYCVYQLAKGLGHKADAEVFKQRSFWYKNLWNDSLKLMRGRNKDGSWFSPFNPTKNETGPNFYEGHAYTWSYSTPHDVKGLINLFGGKKPFVDSLTNAVSNHYQAYNEPCMLQVYLFVWGGRPDLTQKYVRKATAENFTDAYNGLPGNDDSGTTSAWYLWSRMGIFPVAGQNLYIIGSPSSSKTTIHMESGKDVVITAHNASEENIYIQSAKFNGKKYDKAFFTHDDIVKGAKFEFVMGAKPSKWGRNAIPPSLSDK
jgi:predicted alpha-1,2-mannosidase